MFIPTFSQRLLAFAIFAWLACIVMDVLADFPINPASNTIAAICFLMAIATAFIAGSVYGREVEYERAQRELRLKEEDVEKQPLLGPDLYEDGFEGCAVHQVD